MPIFGVHELQIHTHFHNSTLNNKIFIGSEMYEIQMFELQMKQLSSKWETIASHSCVQLNQLQKESMKKIWVWMGFGSASEWVSVHNYDGLSFLNQP